MDKIYFGTWCHKEESSIRLFFGWYFQQSLKDSTKYPRELTEDEWFEKFKLFHEKQLPIIRANTKD
jgi:hypothetical protein